MRWHSDAISKWIKWLRSYDSAAVKMWAWEWLSEGVYMSDVDVAMSILT